MMTMADSNLTTLNVVMESFRGQQPCRYINALADRNVSSPSLMPDRYNPLKQTGFKSQFQFKIYAPSQQIGVFVVIFS